MIIYSNKIKLRAVASQAIYLDDFFNGWSELTSYREFIA